MPGKTTVRERDMQRTIEKLRDANEKAVARAGQLMVELEAARAEIERLKMGTK